MAEVLHRYIGKTPSDEEQKQQAERAALDSEWRRKRIAAEHARQMLHEAKLLAMKGELVSKQHVSKQAAYLLLCLRQRLLTLSSELSRKIVEQGSLDQRVIAKLIDVDVREALDTIASSAARCR